MEEIQKTKDTIETIMDEIDEGLVQIESIYLTPTELENYEDDNNIDG